jgi:long-chain fatty acid transport protein
MGNVGWQDWSEFGEIELGIDNTQDPTKLTNPLSFDDTWHVAVGAQYRMNDQWKANVGLAYDSGFQDTDDVSPLFPVNSAWRFGVGGRGDLVGGYDQTLSVVFTVYGNWAH